MPPGSGPLSCGGPDATSHAAGSHPRRRRSEIRAYLGCVPKRSARRISAPYPFDDGPDRHERGGTPIDKDITLDLHIEEDDTSTNVTAVLDIRGDHFEASGRARRNPSDKSMPVIGEELAVARALQALAGEVMEGAQTKIEKFLDE
jgi:hypothetical protein